MIYRCLIVDDEELARELLVSHLSQLPEFNLVGTCGSALEARRMLQTERVDLIFLDIEMPVLKGTEFLKGLRNPPQVIFTTAYRHYAIDGFDLNAVDYLLKPITFERFFRATEKYLQQQLPSPEPKETPTRKDHVFVRKDRKQVKLLLDEIQYVESVKDYVRIVTEGEQHLIKFRLSAFREELDDRFIRIHRSYIVNADKVTAFTKHDVEIGQKEVPIGEMYRAEVAARLGG